LGHRRSSEFSALLSTTEPDRCPHSADPGQGELMKEVSIPMRKMSRVGAVVAAAVSTASVLLPAGAASAHERGPLLGSIQVCNHSGYMFNVFADGPSIREDDLAGSFDECTDWARVLPGAYQVGFGMRTSSAQNVIIQARFKRDDHVFYKVFNNEGVLGTSVGPDQLTRVDLFIPQG
jgi:hypothetical protein